MARLGAAAGRPERGWVWAYVGPVVPDEERFRTAAFSRSGNMFQLNFLRAMAAAGRAPDEVLSYVPVPTSGRPRRWWTGGGVVDLGGALKARLMSAPNIPLLKQLHLGVAAMIRLWRWGRRLRKQAKVVVSYNLTVPAGLFLWLGARLAGAKLVACLCDINIPGETVADGWMQRWDYAQHRSWIPRLDAAIAVTPRMVTDFAPRLRHCVVEGGVKPDCAAAATAAADGACADQFVMTLAGSLDEYNGALLAIEALRQCRDARLRLLVAGDGPLRAAVREAARADARIEYLGFLSFDDVLCLYRRSHLLLNLRLTRRIRTPYFFPGKVIEYLASGTAVLSTCCAHIAAEYGEHLYLLREESAAALARSIEELAARPRSELAARAMAAREWMLREKSWPRQAARIERLLHEVVAE